jgi:hypothetical protein
MANQVTLTFAGESKDLQQAAKQAEKATKGVGDQATKSSDDFGKAAKGSSDFTGKLGKLGAGVSGMTDAFDTAGGTLDAFLQLQNANKQRAQQQKRALVDVQQAQEDYNQALRDGKQAAIDTDQAEVDLEQARLDQATTLKEYNTAVKEHGRNSAEARQALIDMKQAGVDVKQAQEDAAQATRDASQANIDAKGAQLDLNDAQREAHPPDVAKWSQDLQMFAPLLSGLVGITALVTAAQWAWNAAQLASPTTWIILGIVALVAIIVLIATKTRWFQNLWRAAWSGIKSAASNAWNFIRQIPGWIGSAFSRVAGAISSPFRAAFNFIASAWNNTIGRLSFTFPGWIPGIGGNSISVPQLPHFHSGGVVPGTPGSEQLAVLQAGERVTPASGAGGATVVQLPPGVLLSSDMLVEAVSRAVRGRGGNVQLVLGGRNA